MCPGKDGHSQCMRAEYTATQLDFNEQISEMEPQRRSWHLMRHPGLCGLRAVICALIVLALCVVLTLIPRKGTDPEPVMNGTASVSHTLGPRRLRETANGYMASLSDSWMDHPSPPHPYATNMWWRLANHTVKEYGSKNCYVCTQFPHSTTEWTGGLIKITTHQPSWLWWLWQQLISMTIRATMCPICKTRDGQLSD